MIHSMKRNLVKVLVFTAIINFIAPGLLTAQNQISLLETDKVKEYLTLGSEQYKVINTAIEQIKVILEEDKKIISKLRERFKSGDEPGFFEKIKVKLARDSRVDKIDDLLDDIENQLEGEQKIKLKNIKKPALKPLSKKEITE